MFEATLLESSPQRISVITSRHHVAALLAGLTGFLVTWKLLPILFFAVSVKAALVYSLWIGTGVALHALMACYVFSEARRLGFGRFRWLAATLFTSVAGYLTFLIHSARRTGNWKRATVPLASLFEVLLLGALVLVPLARTQALGLNELRTDFDNRPLPPPPRIVAVIHEGPNKPAVPVMQDGKVIAPREIPDTIADIVEDPVGAIGPDIGVIGAPPMAGGISDGVFRSILSEAARTSPPSPVPVQPKPKQIQRIRVGGHVEAAKLIFQPRPTYPHLAIVARIQGTVRLEAVIGTDGRVQNLKVLSGHPLLIQSALDAVAQWRYQPTLLNGEPVEVQTEIAVNFLLGG